VLALERLSRDFLAAPLLVKIGVIGLALSLLDDATLHLASGTLLEPIGIGHGPFSPDELAAHLTAFASMVVIFVGVVADGVRRSRARRRAQRP
jgi:hypothetical protein